MEKLKKKGRTISPVVIEGRTIARNFWGKAWCENLERYSDYANRLPRGRTYVRNGSVVDLQIERGQVRAMVSGSDIYSVKIEIGTVSQARWKAICKDCLGSVGSLVELLQGKLSKNVMERVCREGDGLFPSPREIKMTCSCPDWAGMCKHVAAVLYGAGARLDVAPDLLFTLRGVDRSELIAGAGAESADDANRRSRRNAFSPRTMSRRCSASKWRQGLRRLDQKNSDTVLKSGTSGRTKQAAPINRQPATEPVSLNRSSTKFKPTPIRSRDAKPSPVSSGGRPQPTDADADRAEARIARGKAKSATQQIRPPRETPKQKVAASEPIAAPLERKSRRGAQPIGAKWTKWKKQKARHS